MTNPLDGLQLFAQYKAIARPACASSVGKSTICRSPPDREGETSKDWEFGANVLRESILIAGDRLRFKASYFRNRYDNYIILAALPEGFGQQHYTQHRPCQLQRL